MSQFGNELIARRLELQTPQLPVWIANTLSCDMTQPYLKRGEVLNRYETLYFQPRQSSRKICDPASSTNHISTFLHSNFFLTQSYHSLGLWEATTGVWGL